MQSKGDVQHNLPGPPPICSYLTAHRLDILPIPWPPYPREMTIDGGVAAYSIFALTDCKCKSEADASVTQSFWIPPILQLLDQLEFPWPSPLKLELQVQFEMDTTRLHAHAPSMSVYCAGCNFMLIAATCKSPLHVSTTTLHGIVSGHGPCTRQVRDWATSLAGNDQVENDILLCDRKLARCSQKQCTLIFEFHLFPWRAEENASLAVQLESELRQNGVDHLQLDVKVSLLYTPWDSSGPMPVKAGLHDNGYEIEEEIQGARNQWCQVSLAVQQQYFEHLTSEGLDDFSSEDVRELCNAKWWQYKSISRQQGPECLQILDGAQLKNSDGKNMNIFIVTSISTMPPFSAATLTRQVSAPVNVILWSSHLNHRVCSAARLFDRGKYTKDCKCVMVKALSDVYQCMMMGPDWAKACNQYNNQAHILSTKQWKTIICMQDLNTP